MKIARISHIFSTIIIYLIKNGICTSIHLPVRLDKIKELVNKKFETSEVKLNTIEHKFDAVKTDLQNTIRVVENRVDEVIDISKQDRAEKVK